MLFKDSIDAFLVYLEENEYAKQTYSSYRKNLYSMSQWLEKEFNGPVYVDEIVLEDLTAYLAHMKDRGCVASTRNRMLFILRSFFNYATEKGLVESNFANKIRPVKARTKERIFLTRDEVEDLCNAIHHPVIRAVVWAAYFSGLRPSELINLTLQDLDMDSNIIHVRQGKGNKDRDVPLCDELKDILLEFFEGYRKDINSERVFATKQSGSLSIQFLNRMIGNAVKVLGWKKDVTAHILRHSFASRLVAKDVNLVKIQRLLGHKNIKTTALYSHTNMEELSDALKKL